MQREFEHQAGMVSRSQALQLGLTHDGIRSRVERGIWQRAHSGTYATFSGPLPRDSVLWGAVLAAGRGAALSHYAAAELAGFLQTPRSIVHVTIPWPRSAPSLDGVHLHVSRRLDLARHPSRTPPQTRVEETVLDLADTSGSADEAVAWLVAACSHRLTTVSRVSSAIALRRRLKWRREISEALADVGGGSLSLLEIRYLRDVERAHGLPPGKRQDRHTRLGGSIYDDVSYSEFGLVVELDGRANHRPDQLFRDLDRDNLAALRGDPVLHYGWDAVTYSPCRVAEQVIQALRARGWVGRPHRCRRPECMIGVI